MTQLHQTCQWVCLLFAAISFSLLVGCSQSQSNMTQQPDDDPTWTLTFSDEFDGETIDTEKWQLTNRKNSPNNEKQYYLPEQAAVVDGVLRITSTNEPYDGKAYRSAYMRTWYTQRYGRFEARAKVPTSKGIWPAFWLLPRGGSWPKDGEIDILEHAGSDPTRVSCAFHFTNIDGLHDYVGKEYRPKDADGNPVVFPDDFHVFAAEWSPTKIVYFVDDVEIYRINNDEVPIPDTPMAVILNTAVGGWFDGDPDESTVFPQTFDIDYVRIYQRKFEIPEPKPKPIRQTLINGDFKQGGKGWEIHTNTAVYKHNLNSHHRSIAFDGEGDKALKLYGPFSNTRKAEAVQERIHAQPGKTYTLRAMSRTNSDDALTGTQNRLEMYVRFMDADGNPIPDAEVRKTVVDGDTPTDHWHEQSLSATAPDGARTLQVGFAFHQHEQEPGAAWIDQVSLSVDE